ncbi:SCO4848 family membrane protein [Amycolatopsis sp. cg5]|uniref:SCO4848 family membrane protein n=1 Tax=Amycolatopsis sp. cg5 TaxID=3238802 RepID=UPI0035267B95
MSRRVSLFLLAFGVWSWIIWITFVKNLWAGDRSWAADGSPTAYFIVHFVLAVVSFALGTIIGVIGWRGFRGQKTTNR